MAHFQSCCCVCGRLVGDEPSYMKVRKPQPTTTRQCLFVLGAVLPPSKRDKGIRTLL